MNTANLLLALLNVIAAITGVLLVYILRTMRDMDTRLARLEGKEEARSQQRG